MEKINGYARAEAEALVGYIAAGRKEGKTLTELFARYGKEHGRAGGSVRNYYYRLLRTEDSAAKRLLEGTQLRAERVRPFSPAEKEEMLRLILIERGKGNSVRRAIANVCGGDEKKMLRYQNKYRNMLKKQPEEVRAAAQKLGMGAAAAAPRPCWKSGWKGRSTPCTTALPIRCGRKTSAYTGRYGSCGRRTSACAPCCRPAHERGGRGFFRISGGERVFFRV